MPLFSNTPKSTLLPRAPNSQYCGKCISMFASLKGLQALASYDQGFIHYAREHLQQSSIAGCQLCSLIYSGVTPPRPDDRLKLLEFHANHDAKQRIPQGEKRIISEYPFSEPVLDSINGSYVGSTTECITLALYTREGLRPCEL